MESFQGTHYEIGFQVGQKYQKIIKNLLRYENVKINTDDMPMLDSYYETTLQYYPQYIEELLGLARGAHVNFKRVFAYICINDIESYRESGCTDIVVKNTATEDKKPLIVHTNDESGYLSNYMRIYKIKAYDEPEILVFSIAGLLINSAVNKMGLCFTGNNLVANDGQRKGVPKFIIYRAMIASRHLDAAVDIIKKVPRASADNYVIGTLTSQINIECSATDFKISPCPDLFVHTNHFIESEMTKYEDKNTPARTRKRLNRAYQLLKAHRGHLTVERLQSLIMDHGSGIKKADSAICRHSDVSTIFAIIIDIENKEIIHFKGRPCERNLEVLSFP